MSIAELQRRAHEIAVDKGWWSCEFCEGTGCAEFEKKEAKCLMCDGSGKSRNDAEIVALIHSEVSEALECLRDGTHLHLAEKAFDHCLHNLDLADADADVEWVRENREFSNLAEELADVVIRVMDYAESKNIDLEKAIEWKTAYNAGRPHKHGKKF